MNKAHLTFIQHGLSADYPIAVYRKPNTSEPELFKGDISHEIEAQSDIEGFVAFPFAEGSPLLFKPHLMEETTSSMPEQSTPFDFHFASKDEHTALVKKMVDTLQTGALDKIIVSRIQEVAHLSVPPHEMFNRLDANYPDAHVFLFHHPSSGTWLGASPENLIIAEEGKFQTDALAGTRAAVGSEKSWPKKEVEEHAFVKEYIKGMLSEMNVHGLEISDNATQKFGNIEHIISRFEFTGDFSPLEVAQKLHPTPAVCGLPKEKAKALILDAEKHNRGYYSGYAGTIGGRDEASLFVTLRCLNISGDKMGVFVGGGITSESNPESEWRETEMKAHSILGVLENL